MQAKPNKQQIGQKIQIAKDGPYRVSGSIPLAEVDIVHTGDFQEYRLVREYPLQAFYLLCRCGKTTTPPFCDGSHEKCGFVGTETASRAEYADRAELLEGPALDLKDDHRCALAHFCYRRGSDVWALTENSDNPVLRQEAIQGAIECPSGRLEVYDKSGNRIEQDLSPRIEILQDREHGVSGPIFVKGYIQIESEDGFLQETRNRITLCRCGRSFIRPFCDAMHVAIEFHDR
jgi:CDGSH-type Zn-finger protein